MRPRAPALRPALTEWPRFDEVDNQLRSHTKRRIEADFLRNRMAQLQAPFAERSQRGVEVLEYFNLGHAFACVVAEEMPREPGVGGVPSLPSPRESNPALLRI